MQLCYLQVKFQAGGHGIRFRTVPNKATESDGKQRLITLVYLRKGQLKIPQKTLLFPYLASSDDAKLLQSVVVSSGRVCLSSHQFVPSQSVCACVWGCGCVCVYLCVCASFVVCACAHMYVCALAAQPRFSPKAITSNTENTIYVWGKWQNFEGQAQVGGKVCFAQEVTGCTPCADLRCALSVPVSVTSLCSRLARLLWPSRPFRH